MEEKILEALNKINERLDRMDQRLDQMGERFDKTDQRFDQMEERLDKTDQRFDQMGERFEKSDQKILGIEGRIAQEIRQQILDHMFVFETEYGRKMNIAYEEIIARNQKEGIQNEMIQNLERRTDMNSAFVHSHEERIAVLEKAQC